MTTNVCSNCGSEFPRNQENSLCMVQGTSDPAHSPGTVEPLYIAGLCPECLDGARTIKLVLKRNIAGQFAYEQFSVLDMANRAFGTAE